MLRFEELDIWKEAVDLGVEIFLLSEKVPSKIQNSLGNQLRSAVLSISNNIAEGAGSSSKQEFKNFLNFSIRSLYETISILLFALKIGYIDGRTFEGLYQKFERLVKKIRKFRSLL
ncbi:MAG TPA: four helix bundle protein [bacterium]|nr:four helix bundle protein [bacterium]HPP29842.1 four helix bundle protein [bacterium]